VVAPTNKARKVTFYNVKCNRRLGPNPSAGIATGLMASSK